MDLGVFLGRFDRRTWSWRRVVARVRFVGLLLSALSGCSDRAAESARLGSLEQALDFPSGTVQGTVTWNGAVVSGLAAQGLFVWMLIGTNESAYTYVQGNGDYTLPNIPLGDHVLNFEQNGCSQPAGVLASTSVSVEAAQTTTLDVDLTAGAGLVSGVLTSNGVPLGHASVSVEGLCGGWGSDASGAFAHLLPPGSYSARVRSPNGVELGSFEFVVAAGESLDLGDVDFDTGSVAGTVSWNGAPVSGLTAQNLFAWIEQAPDLFAYAYVDGAGNYAISNVPTGGYQLKIEQNGCSQARGVLGRAAITLGPGDAERVDMDVTAGAGRVAGVITNNGAPLANPSISVEGLCGSWSGDLSGAFAHLLPPGSYAARVRNSSGVELGAFDFAVSAGQDLDFGVIDFSSGNIVGTVSWNDAPVSGLAAQNLFAWIEIGPGETAYTYVDGNGGYAIDNVPPGEYVLNLEQNGCSLLQGLLGTQTVSVSAGAAARADIDVTLGAGRVTGFISSNGLPLAHPGISVEGLCGGWGSDASGTFAHLMPPGSFTATVRTNIGVVLGTFDFAVIAAQTTDVDIGTTPPGSFISVPLSGGTEEVGGLEITFAEVATAGQTTVVESGFGPPPPSGYRIVGIADAAGQPRYWDIDTTAGHSGLITVCIHYDAGELRGAEGLVRLVHDAGSGFQDITISLDTADDVVCGATSSLSPFAVVEPLSVTNVTTAAVSARWVIRSLGVLEVSASFANTGTTTIPLGHADIFVDLDSDLRRDRNEPVHSFSSRNVLPGATRTARTTFVGLPRGSYQVVAIADPALAIPESNETDNLGVTPIAR